MMNEENVWDHNAEEDAMEDPVVCGRREEVLQSLNKKKNMKNLWTCQCPRWIWEAS